MKRGTLGHFSSLYSRSTEHRKYGLESRVRGFLDRKYGLDEKEEKNCNVREYFIFGDFLILWLQVEDGVSFLGWAAGCG